MENSPLRMRAGESFVTVLRGKRVMWEKELLTPAQGERVRFLETLST